MITPFVYDSVEDIEPPFPFPSLAGNFEDEPDDLADGWEATGTEWFVDASGFGADDELALTPKQFAGELRRYVAENPTHGFALTGVGQFQVRVGAFYPV